MFLPLACSTAYHARPPEFAAEREMTFMVLASFDEAPLGGEQATQDSDHSGFRSQIAAFATEGKRALPVFARLRTRALAPHDKAE